MSASVMTSTTVDLEAAPDRPAVAADGGPPLHVVAILPTLNPYGGVVSVVNLLEQLLEHGHRYTLASLSQIGTDVVHPRSEPLYVATRSRLGEVLPTDVDVILATSWETVFPALELHRRAPRASLWYFVQGFETDFTDAGRDRDVLRTYELIGNRVVKTDHLKAQLAEHGWHAHRVRPGMNLDIFYPRDVPEAADDTRRVLSIARPNAPHDHRGWEIVREVYARLAATRPGIELHLFGSEDVPDLPFPVVDHGRLAPASLPRLYSSVDVYVDASRSHGFGRTGVEAMACHTACVLSRSGGPDEYATDGENALMVPVGDVDATVAAIERLLDDAALRDRLAAAGYATVQRYSDTEAAREMLALWRADLARADGSRAEPTS